MIHPCGLHFVIGKKGAGKSMYACKVAWKILAETKRIIVTNIPVDFAGLQNYMEEKYGWTESVRERVWLVEDLDDMRQFYVCRGFGWWVPGVSKEDWGRGRRPCYAYAYRWAETLDDVSSRQPVWRLSASDIDREVALGHLERMSIQKLRPVQFLIDEIQVLYPARGWQDVSPALIFYLSQQRKLGDDIFALSQAENLMDKQFRDLADDWMVITNWGRKRKGWFRLPKACTWHVFDQAPGRGVTPMVNGTMKLDISGVGQTYRTEAGVGIEGLLEADKGEKVGGLHWGWFFVAVAIGIWLIFQVPGGLRGLMSWGFQKVLGRSNPVQPVFPAADLHSVNSLPIVETNWVQVPAEPEKLPRVSGYVIRQDRMEVWLDGGGVLHSHDPDWRGLVRRAGRPYSVHYGEREYLLRK